MRSRNKQHFNYSREPHAKFDYSKYGLHFRNHHLHIDTKQLKKYIPDVMLPELFAAPRNTHYFIPAKVKIYDYYVNRIRDVLMGLRYEWEHDYVGFIKSVKKPEDIYKNIKFNEIMQTTNSESYDEFSLDGFLAAAREFPHYTHVINGLYYSFIQKIQQEYMNIWSYIIYELGDDNEEFYFGALVTTLNNQARNRLNLKGDAGRGLVEKCPHFKYFDFLSKVVNFLKHKSIKSYYDLRYENKKRQQNCEYRDEMRLLSKETQYHNGESAINLLLLPDSYLEDTIDNLCKFTEEACQLAFGEDPKQSRWNSEEYIFKTVKEQLLDDEY